MYPKQPQSTRAGQTKVPRDFQASSTSSPAKMTKAQMALKSPKSTHQGMDYQHSAKLGRNGQALKARDQLVSQRKLNANRYSMDASNQNQTRLYGDSKRGSHAVDYDNAQGAALPGLQQKQSLPRHDKSYMPGHDLELSHETLMSDQQKRQLQGQMRGKQQSSIHTTVEAQSRAMHQDQKATADLQARQDNIMK